MERTTNDKEKKATAREPESTVFVVDDNISVRTSLRRLLTAHGYSTRIFSSALEFLEQVKHTGPDCLVLDIRLPGLNGIELQEKLIAKGWTLPIVFITGHGDIPMTVKAMTAGAVDFLSKPFSAAALLSAIEKALARSRKDFAERTEIAELKALLSRLTPREMEVLRHVVTGKLNKQIANDLNISEKTVKLHRGRVTAKLGIYSVAELVRLADRLGLPLPRERRSLEPAQPESESSGRPQ